MHLAGTVVVGNRSPSGGGVHLGSGNTVIENCTLNANQASGSLGYYGGGILLDDGALTVLNSTIAGNFANPGGGIANYQGVLSLAHSTLSVNSATNGGGLWIGQSENYITNSVIARNTAATNANIDSTAGLLVNVNNLTAGDPMLAPLGDYGSPTPTMPPLPGSPAIDAGLTSATNSLTDQRGFARVVGSAVDIGAVELETVQGYAGNPDAGFSGAIDRGSLTLSDDGTNVFGLLIRGPGVFNDALVIYVDSVLPYLKFLEHQRAQEEWADVLPSREVEQEVLDASSRPNLRLDRCT